MRHLSVQSDVALHEPVVITRNGRDRLVLLSVAQLRELLARALEQGQSPRKASSWLLASARRYSRVCAITAACRGPNLTTSPRPRG